MWTDVNTGLFVRVFIFITLRLKLLIFQVNRKTFTASHIPETHRIYFI